MDWVQDDSLSSEETMARFEKLQQDEALPDHEALWRFERLQRDALRRIVEAFDSYMLPMGGGGDAQMCWAEIKAAVEAGRIELANQPSWMDELQRRGEAIARVQTLAAKWATQHGMSWLSLSARALRRAVDGAVEKDVRAFVAAGEVTHDFGTMEVVADDKAE